MNPPKNLRVFLCLGVFIEDTASLFGNDSIANKCFIEKFIENCQFKQLK